jgi:hypothetical protein
MASDEIVEWTCIDCPQRNPKLSHEDCRFATEAGADPLMCPWCGNQTLIKWEDRNDVA